MRRRQNRFGRHRCSMSLFYPDPGPRPTSCAHRDSWRDLVRFKLCNVWVFSDHIERASCNMQKRKEIYFCEDRVKRLVTLPLECGENFATIINSLLSRLLHSIVFWRPKALQCQTTRPPKLADYFGQLGIDLKPASELMTRLEAVFSRQ